MMKSPDGANRCKWLSVIFLMKSFFEYSSGPYQTLASTKSVLKLSSHKQWKMETFTEKGTRYKKHCTWDNDASVPFKVGTWVLTHFFRSPSAAPLYFPESHWWSEIFFLSKVILGLGEVRIFRAPNLGYRGAESPGWLDALPKNCTRRDAWAGMLSWWSCQSPIDHSCGLLNHPNSFRGGVFKLNAKFDVDSLLYSLSHFECDSQTVHTLTQWCLLPPLPSTIKSSLFTHVHSSPLSLAARLHSHCANPSRYMNNGWTFSKQTSHLWSTLQFIS